jgi:hypothetical protein
VARRVVICQWPLREAGQRRQASSGNSDPGDPEPARGSGGGPDEGPPSAVQVADDQPPEPPHSREVKSIEIHDLDPPGDEVAHELLGIVGPVDL